MSSTGESDEEVNSHLTVYMMVRFAYLRLANLVNFLDSDSRNVSQWDQIDARLADVAKINDVNYTNRYVRID